MATSGSTNFSRNRQQACLGALGKLGVYGIGRTPSAEDMTLASDTLNMMMKSWSAQGLHLWAKEEAVLFLSQYEAKYNLGNTSTNAYCCLSSDLVTTKLNASVAVNGTSVTTISTTGMTVGDYIGIVLDDKSLYWTTIATIPSSTTLTLTVGVTGVASSSNLVFTFTNRIYKPLRILSAQLIGGYDAGSSSTQIERYLNIIAYQDYRELIDKTTNGDVNQLMYQPKNTNGLLNLYPRPSDCSYRIQFTYERIIEDLDTITDDFDMPVEWMECIIWQLAARLAPDFSLEDKAAKMIIPLASQLLDALKNWDTEITEVQLQPGSRGYYG